VTPVLTPPTSRRTLHGWSQHVARSVWKWPGRGGEEQVCFGAVCGNMGFNSAEVHDHGALLSPPYLRHHLMSNCLAARERGAR
jgi:hypothetical protein